MKTAEERAGEVLDRFGVEPGVFRFREVVSAVADAMRVYARDQRHLCAKAVDASRLYDAAAESELHSYVHGIVMNTPFPGENEMRVRLDPDALHVQQFSPGTHAPDTSAGFSTRPSACCGTGCTEPPC